MRSRDESMRRKRREYPHVCTLAVPRDWTEWTALHGRMLCWVRQHAGPSGFVKSGRLTDDGTLVDWMFRSSEVAAEFRAEFGDKLIPEPDAASDVEILDPAPCN
jgi:hypothetical protein